MQNLTILVYKILELFVDTQNLWICDCLSHCSVKSLPKFSAYLLEVKNDRVILWRQHGPFLGDNHDSVVVFSGHLFIRTHQFVYPLK